MAKILVTGAKGQLGQCLLDVALLFPTHQIVGYDIDQLNILDAQAVYQAAKAEETAVIINCAAYTQVDKAEGASDHAYSVNEKAVKELTTVCDRLGVFFVHLSTDYVFDGEAATPYKESDKPRPMTVYGASKWAGEIHALSYKRSVVVRTSWLYSPYGNNFVATMLHLGMEREEIGVVNDQTGSPTYAPHLAKALLQMIGQIERQGAPESLMGLYHFADKGQCSWFDFAQKIKEHARFGARIVPISSSAYPTPAQRPAYSVLNTQKIVETFGVTTPCWENGIKTYFTCKRI